VSALSAGLVIGKFYPPHAGHHLLIRTAAAVCERVFVAVLAASDETIPLAYRVAWLRQAHPGVSVRGAIDDVPVDYASAQAWAAHVAIMRELVPEPVDAVFTSEAYGPELARWFDAAHVPVDPLRRLVPCSGTAVRDDPAAHWEHLGPGVRAWYATRVVVVGAESSGTTTLARGLAAHYNAPYVPEYGRERTIDKLATARARAALAGRPAPGMDGLHWPSTDFADIARRQIAAEDAAAAGAPSPLVVCDTDALATGIWHERYRGEPSAVVTALAAGLAARSRRRYLLTDHADVPFHQDGIRDGEHLRAWMTTRFAAELSTRDIPHTHLSGTPETRLRGAVAAVDGWLGELSGTRDRVAAPGGPG
jgi:HTH-type transcriptional regulator, transcriptional repressor of NAD biosynthesis genes